MTDRVDRAADIIAAARLAGARLAILPEDVRPQDVAGAYAVQEAVHARLAAKPGGRRIGYKIGCTTRVMQEYLGLAHPCSAGVFAGVVHQNGASVRFDDYRRVGVECEIAVRLGRPVSPSGAPFTGEALRDSVAAYYAAIEIVDDRYVDWRATDAATLIADDYFAAGAVLGPEVPAAAAGDIAEAVGVTFINGVEVGRGLGRDVLGHPLNALAWLANSLTDRGIGLEAGEIVLTGSLVETKWLARGDWVEVSVSGLGEARLSVV